LEHIKNRNAENLSFKLAINEFSDLSIEEYRNLLKRKVVKGEELSKFLRENDKFINKNDDDDDFLKRNLAQRNPIDWSKYLGSTRNQGYCGSCWAFSATAMVESCLAIKNRAINQYLSTQQMVDCDKQDQGCSGGVFPTSFNYIKTYGLMAETSYPYEGRDSTCRYNSSKVAARVTGFTYCSSYGRENPCTVDKVYNILTRGPASVGIDGGSRDFMNYSSGILDDRYCSQDNHAVLLVGYGVENGREYWLVRNSWGSGWGINGHVKVLNNDSNHHSCYVTNEVYQFSC